MRVSALYLALLTGCASFAPVGQYPAYREVQVDARFDGNDSNITAIRTDAGYQLTAPEFRRDVNYLTAMGKVVMCILQDKSCSESYVLYDPDSFAEAVESKEFSLIIDTDPDHRWEICGANSSGCAVGSRIFIEPPKVMGQAPMYQTMGHEFMHVVVGGWHDHREIPSTSMDRFRAMGTWEKDINRANRRY